MKLLRLFFSAVFIGAAMLSQGAVAAHIVGIDDNAAVVQLRTSCLEDGNTLKNCFTNLNTMNTWIWDSRNPSSTSPLLVAIGPGTFNGAFECVSKGNVSLRGAGMGSTVIQNTNASMVTMNCANMSFSDMTLRSTEGPYGVIGKAGSTVWNNIEIDAKGYAWYEPGNCTSKGTGKHYWFSSRIVSRSSGGYGTVGYFSACDESWFYGSEITAIGLDTTTTGFSSGTSSIEAIVANGGGEVHVYGSVIRTVSQDATVFRQPMVGAKAMNGGEIHIHGTGIDIISAGANNIIALKAMNGGTIHANEAAYNLKTGTDNTTTRISKDDNPATHVHAPYLWPEHATPPNITSVIGADMAVVTSTSDSRPHLVIYDSNCPSKWYDTADKLCRP